jgi:hypothetical protein
MAGSLVPGALDVDGVNGARQFVATLADSAVTPPRLGLGLGQASFPVMGHETVRVSMDNCLD